MEMIFMLKRTALLGSLAYFALSPAVMADDKWAIDPAHSDAHFSVKHLMISNVQGDFGHISGTANFDGEHFGKASVEATIPIADINTREPKRDEHLKSPEFFDVQKYPSMTFKSKKITSAPGGDFKMVGDLTLHGVTKEVVLTGKLSGKPIKDPFGKIRIGAEASTKINRKDFGISFQQALDNGGAMIGDDVAVTLDVELIKQSDG
jgi:polyisoprenoid-binding protein YceI